MAKGKYVYWLSGDGLLLLAAWARDGLTDEQIAKNCGISRSTLSDWKNRFSDISDALKKGKEIVDVEVENALHKKALGYTVKLKKTFKVKRIEYENGKKVSEVEELKTGYDEVHVPADTTAQIFWLKNRKPQEWRDKPMEEVSDENEGGVTYLPPLMDDPEPPLPEGGADVK